MSQHMEGGPAIACGPMPVVKEPEGIGDEFERRRADTLGLPVDIETAASPMFCGERGKPSLQEAAIEIRVVGDDEDDPASVFRRCKYVMRTKTLVILALCV